MGQQQTRDEFNDDFHIQLVTGYIRGIQSRWFEEQDESYIVPQTIIDLCVQFYYHDFEHLLLWIGSQYCSNKLFNELQLLNLKSAERFSVKITDLDQSKLTKLKTRTNNDLRIKINKFQL